jgi:hypothetical protein
MPRCAYFKEAFESGRIRLVVSLRTLYELRKKPDDALAFAERLEILPYYAIGNWNDLEGVSWGQLAGAWGDITKNDALQLALPVRKRVKIRERGIIIDSMQAAIPMLVTIDSYVLCRAAAIQKITDVRPVRPEVAAKTLL